MTEIFPVEMYFYCVLQFLWQLLELHKPKALISVHSAWVVKHQALIRKEHFKINYLMLWNVKNNGNVVKFSICPIESISDLVRQVKKHLSLTGWITSPGPVLLVFWNWHWIFLCNVLLDLISGMMTWEIFSCSGSRKMVYLVSQRKSSSMKQTGNSI